MDMNSYIKNRIGIGYDVHAFADKTSGRKLILGGVDIPYEKGLEGHSDADVLVHAIMDALLGAARLGDIGKHFPDNDPAYKNANSLVLLERVAQIVRNAAWNIDDVDSVIALQSPKISAYRDEMRANIAKSCNLDIDQVGIKATTTERLGFVGQGLGASAQAVCLLSRA